jgi:CubicO group peptidase (beta-lactamase class C family)
MQQNKIKRYVIESIHSIMSATLNDNNIHVYGHVVQNWESVRSVFEQNKVDGLDIGAICCVYHQGQCVLDLSGGWKDSEKTTEPYTSDTLQLVFSTSKGVMAAAIALCVEKGWLDYDSPVAKYWPEFTANEKRVLIV